VNKYEYRIMCPGDSHEVSILDASSFGEHWDKDKFEEEVSLGRSVGMIATHKEKIVGFIMWKTKPFTTISIIAVHERHRRKGIGINLVFNSSRMDWPEYFVSPYEMVTIHVETTNHTAQRFWNKLGFAKFSTIPEYYGDNRNANLMRCIAGNILEPTK